MSFQVFFAFSAGLSVPLHVPVGTYKRMMTHVANTEAVLGIEREEYNGEIRWNRWPLVKKASEISDELYCETVEKHNETVRWLYSKLQESSGTVASKTTEELTPEMAKDFWLGLEQLDVPTGRWSKEYYQSRMEAIYECLRGRESEGMAFDSEALSPRQAADVIVMFSQWLDRGDIRLDLKKGEDQLSSSYWGEYEWCSGCGAVDASQITWDEEADCYDDLCDECKEKNVNKDN